MTFHSTITTTDAISVTIDTAVMEAWSKANLRAHRSYFDQHIIRTDDGCYWVADEGSYETLMADLADRIVATIRAGRSDEH